MRRILAISLLLLFALPAIAPLFALSGTEANIPICCRRNGKHHCMMPTEQAQVSQGTHLSLTPNKCPFYPTASTPTQRVDISLFAAALIFAGILAHFATPLQTEARARVALHCARQKRGPPALHLS